MEKKHQTFQVRNFYKTKIKNSFLGLAVLCCVNTSLSAQTGEGFYFDGGDDRAYIASNSNLQLADGNFSVEFWAKPMIVDGNFRWVVTKDNGNSDMEYVIGISNNNKWRFIARNQAIDIYSSAVAVANTYYHIACTFDGTTAKLYVNGVLDGSTTNVGTSYVNTESISIGCRQASSQNQFFGGVIDELRMWNTARTSCEINTYKNCEIPTTTTGLVANYHFNQGVVNTANPTINTIVDASGNGYTATFYNVTLTSTISNWVAPGGVVSGYTTALVSLPASISAAGPTTVCSPGSVTLSAGGSSSLDFNGTTGYVSYSHNAGQVPASELTIEGWIYARTVSNTNTILMKGNYGYALALGATGCSTGNKLNYWTSPSCATAITSTGTVPLNQWTHVAVVVKAATNSLEFFINGVSAGTASTGANINNGSNDPLILGRQGTGCPCNYFDGKMDEIKVWNIARTQSQIASGMNSSTPLNSPNLQFYVKADETTGTTSNDLSVNASVGTLMSGTTWEVPSTAPVNAGLSYAWSNGATTSTINVSNTSINTVTITSSIGCSSSASQSVIVNAQPTISVNSGSICTGNNFTISPSGANTYTISGGLSVVSPTSNATFNVTGTSSQGCVSSNTAIASVTVNALPTVVVNSGAICTGNSFTISPSGANTYTISGGLSVVSPTSNATFNVTGTSAQGCNSSNTAIASVTVNTLPTITVNNGAICAGNSFTISPSGANTYSFSTGSAILTPTSTTNYTVIGVDANGCIGSATGSVTVNNCTSLSSGLNGDGINDRVAIPHSPSLNVENAFTLECWFNTNDIVNETNLMEKGRWAGNWLFFIKPKPGQGTTICMASWAWGPTELWGTTDLQTNTWYHFAATWDGTTRKVYLNGVLEASDVPSGDPIANSSELGLGAASGGSYEFNGTIDDARIWNVVRTPAEIAANYSTELTGSETGLVAYYKFDNATAYGNNTSLTTVSDLTSNNNDGTLTNYALTGCSSNFICGAPALGGSCIVPAILSPTLSTVTGNCLVNLNSPTTTDACVTVTFTGTTSSATTYTTPGTYTVNWLFTDGFGATTNATQTIVVNAPSLPAISISETPAAPLNVAFGGTATASSIYGTNYATTAFDNDTITEGWGNTGGSLPDWLEYDFGTGNGKTLIQYSFYCASTMQGGWGSADYDPSVWTFEGFNGTTWDVLDSRVDNASVQDMWHTYTFTNTVAYEKYRINISQSVDNYYTFITELRLYEAGSNACQNKTFTSSINSFATPANYQWQVNGTNVGSNSSSLSLPSFFINDVVTCDINTANTCVTSSVATSNQVVLTTGSVNNITNANICAGETYTYSSNTYSVAGIYTSTFTAASGCDSIVGLNLTVNTCTGLNNLASLNAGVLIYPNPNNGSFIIKSDSDVDLNLINALGEIVQVIRLNDSNDRKMTVEVSSNGIYFITGQNSRQSVKQKVIVTK